MINELLMLAQQNPPADEPSSGGYFGMWQLIAVVGIIALIVGLKIYKNKTMS